MSESEKMNNDKIEIPVDGSLGLLAVGYRGVMAWREARKNAGIDIVAIKKKEYEELAADYENKKAEYEKSKAQLNQKGKE